MRPSTLLLLLGLWPTTACLLLQDAPTLGEGKDCDADDWCDQGLVCLPKKSSSLKGVCAKRGSCDLDTDCDATQLCQGATYSVRGTCQANPGCKSNASCSGGLSCFRGSCYQVCTTSSACGSGRACLSVPRTACPEMETCPDVCQTF